MNHKDLFLLFSTTHTIKDKLILATTSDIRKITGRPLQDCRAFILVSSGTILMEANGKEITMGKYSLSDIMEGVHFTIKKTSEDLKAYCIMPNYKFACQSLKELKPGPETYILNIMNVPVMQLSKDEYETLEKQTKMLEECLRNINHYYREELCCSYFRNFMLELGNILFMHKDEADTNQLITKKPDAMTLDFIRLVWKNFKTEHYADFYAKELNISTKHLARIIKATLGITPHDFICHELLHKSISMLEDNSLTIQQISDMLHFSDQASFSKFFKKYMKVSPVVYRKQEK